MATTTKHEALAREWVKWNGQTGTAKQVARIVARMSEDTLARMMAARGVVIVDTWSAS